MSYHRKGLGDAGDVLNVVATGASVVADPYFPETVCRVQQLQAIENGRPVPSCTKTNLNIGGGVGLRKAIPPLRAYVLAEQYRPWSYVGIAAVAVGVPMLLGYLIGKK